MRRREGSEPGEHDRGRRDLLSDPGARDLLDDAERRDLLRDPGGQDLARDAGVRESLQLGSRWAERIPPRAEAAATSGRSEAYARRRRRS